MIMIIIQI